MIRLHDARHHEAGRQIFCSRLCYSPDCIEYRSLIQPPITKLSGARFNFVTATLGSAIYGALSGRMSCRVCLWHLADIVDFPSGPSSQAAGPVTMPRKRVRHRAATFGAATFGSMSVGPPAPRGLISDAHKVIEDFKDEIAAGWTLEDLLVPWYRVDRPRDDPEPDRGRGILYAVGISQTVQRGAPPFIRR